MSEIKGDTRGISMKGDFAYILHKKGKEGLKKVEEEMAKLGYPVTYNNLKEIGFYPMKVEAMTFLVMKKLFGFDREEFVKMGEFNSKVSLIVRLFMKYFVSLELIAREAPRFWRKYYSVGDLKVVEINKKERYIIIRVENFRHHPLHCATVEGYIISLIKMVLGKEVSSEETKCVHRGDEYHEFVVRW